MNNLIEKSDTELHGDVLAELNFDPSVKITNIGVLVKDGVVTLNGFAPSYGAKWQAVRAAKRLAGGLSCNCGRDRSQVARFSASKR